MDITLDVIGIDLLCDYYEECPINRLRRCTSIPFLIDSTANVWRATCIVYGFLANRLHRAGFVEDNEVVNLGLEGYDLLFHCCVC